MSQSFTGASSLAASALTGTVLASNVVTSSLTTVGALNAGSITSGFGTIDIGASALDCGAVTGTIGTFSGTCYIGDTANANSTLGLTINQGANANHILTFKSSDVATGLTTAPVSIDVEVDDYYAVFKLNTATGGVYSYVLAESTQAFSSIAEVYGGAPQTTDAPTSLAASNFYVAEHDGANGLNDMAVDSNAFAWGEIDSGGNRLTRMLLKADDGELHLGNTTLVALADDEEDPQFSRAMIRERYPNQIEDDPHYMPEYDYKWLQRLGVVGEKDEQGDFLIRVQPYLGMHDMEIWWLYVNQKGIQEALQRDRDGFLGVIEEQDQRIAHLERLLVA